MKGAFAWLLLCSPAFLAGCVNDFGGESEIDDIPYLCDDPAAFEDVLERCREVRAELENGACAGVISFRGALTVENDDPDEVRAGGTLQRSVLRIATDETGMPLASRYDVTGLALFFQYTFTIDSLGGAADAEGSDTVRSVQLRRQTATSNLEDGRAQFEMRLADEVNAEQLNASGGSMTVSRQSENELVADFEADFGDSGAIEGCMHVLRDEVRR